ncbi:MAG: DUF4003 family protein [Clostridia bacterium]|nr:DUF4003 family protein [Clostridia bacterium]
MRERHVIDEELKALLSDPVRLFLTNREAIRRELPMQGAPMHCLCALLCAGRALRLDAGCVRDMRALIRSRTGPFSYFRGVPMLPLATLLSFSLMPESDLERVEKCYAALKAAGFSGSPYLAEAAFLPLALEGAFDAPACAAAAYDMWRRQRKAHPFLSAETACMYALLAAAQGAEPEGAHRETELGYRLLRTEFPAAGTTHAAARVLALGPGETEDKCRRAIELYQAMAARGMKFGRYYELPALAALALLPLEPEALAEGAVRTDARLGAEKGFSAWSLQASQRRLYAASLYAVSASAWPEAAGLEQSVMQSVTGAIIAAQTAACVAASSAAAATAASSGS